MHASARQLTVNDDRLVAGFAALAISIHVLESAVPMPLPGIKPGLSNVVVLLVLLRYNFRMAAAVAMLRVVVGSIFIGTFLSPTFFISLAGTLTSLTLLYPLHTFFHRWTGPLGYGIAMAMAHMSGQFVVAYTLFIPHPGLWTLLPILLTVSMGLGAITGIICASILQRLRALDHSSR